MNNTDESRKEFESFIREEFAPEVLDSVLRKGGSDSYAETMTHWYWKVWQASRAKPIKLPMRQEPRYEYDTGTFMELCEDGNYLDVDEVKQAIEAAGYRYE